MSRNRYMLTRQSSLLRLKLQDGFVCQARVKTGPFVRFGDEIVHLGLPQCYAVVELIEDILNNYMRHTKYMGL